ncbi:MAG: hypothetical protein WA624_06950 [Methylocella sp.]
MSMTKRRLDALHCQSKEIKICGECKAQFELGGHSDDWLGFASIDPYFCPWCGWKCGQGRNDRGSWHTELLTPGIPDKYVPSRPRIH